MQFNGGIVKKKNTKNKKLSSDVIYINQSCTIMFVFINLQLFILKLFMVCEIHKVTF